MCVVRCCVCGGCLGKKYSIYYVIMMFNNGASVCWSVVMCMLSVQMFVVHCCVCGICFGMNLSIMK